MYPNLVRRSMATLIDLGVVFLVVASILRSSMLMDLQWLKTALAIAVPLLYEPMLSAWACTVGQALMWTRVRDSETLQRIPLRRAYMRFVMKYVASLLGSAVSAPGAHVSVFPGGGHRALHDLQARTTVVSAGSAWNCPGPEAP